MPLRIQWPAWGQNRTDRTLTRAGNVLLDDADARVPTGKSGKLKKSGRVELIDAQTVRVSFNTEYAVRQHYLKRYKHDDGEMLFLLNATKAVGPAVQQVLADEIRRALKSR